MRLHLGLRRVRKMFREAIDRWGVDMQRMMVVEEVGEFLVDFARLGRGRVGVDKLAEEVADVRVMLAQVEEMYGLEAEVDYWVDIKLRRLRDRLG